MSPEFTEIDWKCINTIRLLSADMVQQANSGHPGAPMGLAPLAHVLFSRFLRFDPKDPHWVTLFLSHDLSMIFRLEEIDSFSRMVMHVLYSTRCFIC